MSEKRNTIFITIVLRRTAQTVCGFCRPRIRAEGVRTFTAILIAMLLTPAAPRAERVTAAAGVTFDAPLGLIAHAGQPAPVVMSWKDANDTLSVAVVVLATSQAEALAAELQDWPGSGRSMVDGFGTASVKSLGQAVHAKCSFIGAPQLRDLERAAIQAQVDTSCDTKPQPFVLRSRLIQVLTRSNQVLFRIDSQAVVDSEAQAVAAQIWKTLTVAADQRVTIRAAQDVEVNSGLGVKPVTGGAGIKLRDYGLIRPAWIAGELLGSLIPGLLFGAVLAVVLMKIGVRPITALIGAQVLISLVRVWNAEKNGMWEIDLLGYTFTGVIVVLALRRWAQRQWEKAHPKQLPANGPDF